MRFREILTFEMSYQFSRMTTWIYIIVVIAFTGLASWSMFDNIQKGEYSLNSPVVVSLLAAVGSMFGLFLTAAVGGSAAVRDLNIRISPLVYTTPVNKITYLAGRFTAVFTVQLLVILLVLVLLQLFSVVPAFDFYFVESKMASFLDAFVLFAVPNAFLTSAILFSLSILSSRSMVAYLGAAILFFISLMTMDILAGELGKWELGKMLDPSGLTVLRELRYTQTPVEIQSGSVEISSSLLINRMIWIGIGGALLLLSYIRFGFRHQASGGKKKSSKLRDLSVEKHLKSWTGSFSVPQVQTVFNYKTELRQAKYLFLWSFGRMIKSGAWLLIVLTALILVGVSQEVLEGQLGVPKFPTTWRVLQLLTFFPVVKIMLAVVIAFYAGQLIWKERDSRIEDLSDASPVSNRVLFLSKFSALILMIVLIQVIFLLSGILIQAMQGLYDFEFPLYLKALFGFQFVDLLLFAILAFAVYVLVNHKYLAHLIVFLAYYYMEFSGTLGLNHNLLIFGSDPGWSYSAISQFDPYVLPWFWFKLFWVGWAILLALSVHLFWNRGKENSFGKRLATAKNAFSGNTSKAGFSAMLMIILVGGFIFYNTNVLNPYVTPDNSTERRVLYEKKYGHFDRIPQPLLSGIKLKAEIYPAERRLEVDGEYLLINTSEVDVDSIHISTTSGSSIQKMQFSRDSKEVLIDNDLGHRIYKLETPLKVGDSLNLRFRAIFDQEGFSNTGVHRSLVKNGTYFGYHLMPDIGYETDREISDSLTRSKFNLPPRPAVSSVYDKEARMDLFGEQQLHFEAVLGTSPEQTAVTAGSLQKSWLENGRRYFHYKTDAPIRHNYEIFSAEYDLFKAKWKDVDISIYHHPQHTANLERMSRGMIESLEYFSKNFSPYPHRQMNLVEYPGSAMGLNGNPVTMSYSEGFTFFNVSKEGRGIDFPFAVISHEVAHQWWGGELRPAYVEGSPLLTESLAWYSAMMVVRESFGEEYLEELMWVLRQEYLTPRSVADVPLIKATDKFNLYRKGPFAMYTLTEYVGEKQINRALRQLLEKFDSGKPPLPTSLDLYSELQEVTPDSLHFLLEDLFMHNTFWELEGGTATAVATGKNEWKVTFRPVTRKTRVNKKGIVTEASMDDYIDIAIYSNSPEGGLGELLYLKKHRLHAGENKIEVKVSKKPDLAGIDPNHLLIDTNRQNNYTPVRVELSSSAMALPKNSTP